ncbi:hypothetical protein Q9291_04325 [Methylophilus aquaticus]|uniref:Uncharacterized protein n=1 Tax=Methylophilus aquaticus TaxID=1971610 RepID=A0ABT9JRG7_9PROT|nr:hypothetical protein [Methylophilus aquaticus]MDP8567069.1 hypothetical protein [Methylophilus aquaticus]
MKLTERDICTKFITPAIQKAGWDIQTQVREEVSFTKGRIIERGKLHSRGKRKRADYILYYKSNIPFLIASIQEQHCIVAKVDALIALCDQLKSRVQQTIADALVAQAVA